MKYTCNDCKFYLPVDVFKGICKLSKEKVLPENEASDKFEKQKKCKFCKHFTLSQNNEFIGKCMSTTDAYPDMNAKNCKDFSWI